LILPLLGWWQKQREKPHNIRRPGSRAPSFVLCLYSKFKERRRPSWPKTA
jgi:hypothetical protein